MTTHQIDTYAKLADVKRGETFTMRGYDYIAYDHPEVSATSTLINAGRRHAGMPSGYELCTVLEWPSNFVAVAPTHVLSDFGPEA